MSHMRAAGCFWRMGPRRFPAVRKFWRNQHRIQAARSSEPIDLTGLFDELEVPLPRIEELADSGTGEPSRKMRKRYWASWRKRLFMSPCWKKKRSAASSVLAVLTELELEGIIRSYPGRRYSRA